VWSVSGIAALVGATGKAGREARAVQKEDSMRFSLFAVAALGATMTPAMAAGVADRVRGMTDIAALIAAQKAPVAKRGPHKEKPA
jgi:hypothetical protein